MAPVTPSIIIPPRATQLLLVLRRHEEALDTYLAVLWFGETKEMCASLKVKVVPNHWVPDLPLVQNHRELFPDLWKPL